MKRRKPASPEANVWLTRRALADIREIEGFSVQKWGRKTAHEYMDGIAAALDRLRLNPQILRLEPDLLPGLHFHRVKKHFLVCDCRDQEVIVLTVIHTSMDIPTRLLELQPQLVEESRLLQAGLRTKSDDG